MAAGMDKNPDPTRGDKGTLEHDHHMNDEKSFESQGSMEHIHHKQSDVPGTMRLAVSATIHCLIGCALGEIIGLLLAVTLGMDTMSGMILAILMGFVAGLGMGVLPLTRSGFGFPSALKTVFAGESLSIAVMEGFEVLTQMFIPGAMEAGLIDGLFWLGLAGGLAVGFVAALPVNYVMIRRGFRHQH